MISPNRFLERPVHFTNQGDNACLSKQEFQTLIKNKINTESYIKQLENLLKTVTDPVEGN